MLGLPYNNAVFDIFDAGFTAFSVVDDEFINKI